MIQRVKTDKGERWAIVFGEHYSLEDFVNLQNGLLYVLKASTHSDLLESMGEDLYWVLDLFETIIPTHDQACEYERHLKKQANKMVE